MIKNKAEYIKAADEVCKAVCDTAAIDSEMDDLIQELEVVTEMTKKFITENAKEAQNQDSYTNRYNSLVERYDKAKSRYDELSIIKEERRRKSRAIKRCIRDLSEREELITEFDDCLWLTVVDSVVVNKDGSLTFRFFSGIEVEGQK